MDSLESKPGGFALRHKTFWLMEGFVVDLPKDLASRTDTTFRHERTYNGYRVDELKSWMQKAIRRSRVEEAVWCAVELCTMPKQALVTNMVTRLRVVAIEDVGVAACGAVEVVERELSALMDPKTRKVKLPVTAEGVAVFAKVAAFLARCKHLRLCSDYKAVFLTPQLRDQLRQRFPQVYTNEHATLLSEVSKERDAVKLGRRLQKLLVERDDRAIYVIERLLDLPSPRKCFSSTKPMYYVMDLIRESALDLKRDDIVGEIDILCSWLKEGMINAKVEHILPPLHAALRIIKRDIPSLCPDFASAVASVTVRNFIPGCELLTIPDFAVDKHTAQGRAHGMSALDFAREGALVHDEAVELLDQRYRDIYLESKVLLVGGDAKEGDGDDAEPPAKKTKAANDE